MLIFWQGFFDTLRMEIAGSGIRVLSVCPGKVDVPAASDRFGTTLDEVYIKQASPSNMLELLVSSSPSV